MMNNVLRYLFGIVLLGAIELVAEPYSKTFKQGPLSVKVDLDRTDAGIDDAIAMSVTTEAPPEYEVSLPDFTKSDILQYLIQSPITEAAPKILVEDGRIQRIASIQLEPIIIRDKEFKIGQFTVKFTKADESPHEITTDEITLNVTLPSDEEIQQRLDAELLNSKHPVKRLCPPSIKPYIYCSIAIILFIIIVICIIKYIIKKKKEAAERPIPPPPPWIIAQQALDELMAQNLTEKGEIMPFYNQIQLILRTYIEARFDIHAPERTTEEFMAELRTSSSPVASYSKQLEQFLTHCDLVRFAAHIPQQQEINDTFQSCQSFITATIPNPQNTQNTQNNI